MDCLFKHLELSELLSVLSVEESLVGTLHACFSFVKTIGFSIVFMVLSAVVGAVWIFSCFGWQFK